MHDAGKGVRGIIIAGILSTLTACATDSKVALDTSRVIVRNNIEIATYGPEPSLLNNVAPAAGEQFASKAVAMNAGQIPSHCRVRDRFDRKDIVAYHFNGGKSRVGLNMDVDGFGLSDLGNFEVEKVMVKYRHRFQPEKKKREKCLYESSWQGLFGSSYNEFFVRNEETVYEHFDDEMDHVQDEIQNLFDR